jgi:predicted nuclease of predicted toxin-antitoxin system
MRVLLDENLPIDLRCHIPGHIVETVRFAGLANLSDRALLDAMTGRYDVLVTGDGSLPYQQVIAGRMVAVVVLKSQGNTIDRLLPVVPALLMALNTIRPGEVRVVPP